MTVIPFRGVKHAARPQVRTPDILQLTRNFVKTGICLYLAPWMFWLNFIHDLDEEDRHSGRPR